ncbi:MAG: hypothetical protein DMD95_16985 [Candidatus Rokuibacteriota bacterium]|nr:MAG: hypothetical protein DMD95_16985 [Candidatus Rokubacteria bacterium]
MMGAPFLKRIRVVPERVPTFEGFPYGLPFVRSLDLSFNTAVTYLVGENGSGKSTLVEAIAEACGFPVSGGGRNEAADHHGPEEHSALGGALRFSFARRPRDGYFFRAEFQAHFASLLDQRRADPDFRGDPYSRYGGRSLHTRSHGEAFLAVMLNRMESGVVVMDEPVLLTFPQADIVSFDETPAAAAYRLRSLPRALSQDRTRIPAGEGLDQQTLHLERERRGGRRLSVGNPR